MSGAVRAVTKPIGQVTRAVAKPIVGSRNADKLAGLTNTVVGGAAGFAVGGPIGAGIGATIGNTVDKKNRPKSPSAAANVMTPDVPMDPVMPVLPTAPETITTSPTVPSVAAPEVDKAKNDVMSQQKRRSRVTSADDIVEYLLGTVGQLPRFF